MKMINKASGEAVYFNPVTKAGKEVWVIQGIGSTVVIGRDRQKLKSRTFAQYAQAEAYLARHGFEGEKYNSYEAKRKAAVSPHKGPTAAFIFRLTVYTTLPVGVCVFSIGKKRPVYGGWGIFTPPDLRGPQWPPQGRTGALFRGAV